MPKKNLDAPRHVDDRHISSETGKIVSDEFAQDNPKTTYLRKKFVKGEVGPSFDKVPDYVAAVADELGRLELADSEADVLAVRESAIAKIDEEVNAVFQANEWDLSLIPDAARQYSPWLQRWIAAGAALERAATDRADTADAMQEVSKAMGELTGPGEG